MKTNHGFWFLKLFWVGALLLAGAALRAEGATERPREYPPLLSTFNVNASSPAILRAMVDRNPEKLKEALAAAPELNVRSEQGLTPLILAFYRNETLQKIQMLVQAGADPNFPDGEGNTPLYYALRRKLPEVASFLLNRGARVKNLTAAGHSALQIVTEYWMKDLIMPVLQQGGDFRENFRYGRLIHYAASHQDRTLIAWLLEQGETINRVFPPDGMTPLMAAARWGSDNAVRVLLEFHPQVNAQDNSGWTALMYAVALDKRTIASCLMNEESADFKLKAKDDTTLYQIAGRRGFADLQEELVRVGLKEEKIALPSVLSEFVTLSPLQRLALTMASFELYLYYEKYDSLAGGGSDADQAHARTLLAGINHLNTAKALQERLLFHLEKGDRAGQAEAEEVAKLTDEEFKARLNVLLDDPARLNELRKQRKMIKSGGGSSLLAWDLCHHNALVILGVRAGWISEEEGWKQLQASAELFKAQCPDWTTVANALRTKLLGTFYDPGRAETMLRLFSNRIDTNSPWLLTPIGTPASGVR